MRALSYDSTSDAFAVRALPRPFAGPHDVLVQVQACGLNPVDAKIHQWYSMVDDGRSDWTPGLDVSGEIIEVGPEVIGWRVGDRVLYHGDMFRPHGGFAEIAVQDARTLTPHPDLEPCIAAAKPCAGWTAWRALVEKLNVEAHESFFITGGSGGVGGFAVQLASHFGLARIITTCSGANQAYVKGLGATDVIDYTARDVVADVLQITNENGVPIALDTVGGENDIPAARVLGFEGHMVALVNTVRPAGIALYGFKIYSDRISLPHSEELPTDSTGE